MTSISPDGIARCLGSEKSTRRYLESHPLRDPRTARHQCVADRQSDSNGSFVLKRTAISTRALTLRNAMSSNSSHQSTPIVAGFVAALQPINVLAETAPAFVATSERRRERHQYRDFDDDWILPNMTGGRLALAQNLYRSGHIEVLRSRGEWTERVDRARSASWWAPVDFIPTTTEVVVRLDLIDRLGRHRRRSRFQRPFAPPEAHGEPPITMTSRPH